MIFRIEKHEKYVVLDKGFLNDPRISFKAKGVLAYMLSKPDGWNFVETDIARHGKDQSLAIKTAIKELIAAGYITRGNRKRNEKGQLGAYEYIVREVPTTCENPTQDNPTLGNQSLISNDSTNVMTLPKHEEYNPEAQNPRSGPSQEIDEVDEFVDSYYPSLFEEAYGCEHPNLTPVQRFRTKQIIRDYLQENEDSDMLDIQAAAECFLNRTQSTDGNIRAFATEETLDWMIPQAMTDGYR